MRAFVKLFITASILINILNYASAATQSMSATVEFVSPTLVSMATSMTSYGSSVNTSSTTNKLAIDTTINGELNQAISIKLQNSYESMNVEYLSKAIENASCNYNSGQVAGKCNANFFSNLESKKTTNLTTNLGFKDFAHFTESATFDLIINYN